MSNNVTLIGNLVDDPELRFTPSGVAMAKIASPSIAASEATTASGRRTPASSTGTVWREQAEQCRRVAAEGGPGHRDRAARADEAGRPRGREALSRSRCEIDEIGPSLRWATASVNKTQRSGGDWSGGGGGGGGGGEGADVPPAPVARESYGPDEAPF